MIAAPIIGRARLIACRALACATLSLLAGTPLAGQSADTIRLAQLHHLAEAYDPRAAQLPLLRAQTKARRETISRERLPAFTAVGSAQYLSDVASVGSLPGIGPIGPLNHQYDAYVSVRQALIDPTRGSRDQLEAEQLAESEAAVRSSLYAQRLAVNEAYFAALLRRVQKRVIDAGIADLTERQRVAALRVNAGSALPSEVLMLDAELARRRQALAEARSEERIALTQLASLTGRKVSSTTELTLPNVAPGRDEADGVYERARPEYSQFERSRAVLRAREATLSRADRPRLALVTRTGYGRPGLNGLGREFDSYLSTGLQLEWTPWNWGATRRERDVLRATDATVQTNEAAFTRSIERAANADAERFAALQRMAAEDDAVVSMRQRILAEARLRYDEGDMTAADYVSRANDHLLAQLDRETRRIRLAEVRARYLTTIGLEIP